MAWKAQQTYYKAKKCDPKQKLKSIKRNKEMKEKRFCSKTQRQIDIISMVNISKNYKYNMIKIKAIKLTKWNDYVKIF